MKKIKLYELSVILFFVVCPIVFLIGDVLISDISIRASMLKWFVFFAIGMRLMTAGIKQAISPGFTANSIFEINDIKCYPIVRELGFSNICLGLLGIISLLIPEFRLAAAISGGLYYGLAGYMHLFKKNKNKTEIFAMISDLYILCILIVAIEINLC